MPSFERHRTTSVSNCSNAEIEYGNYTYITLNTGALSLDISL